MINNVDIYCNDLKNKLNQPIEQTANDKVCMIFNNQSLRVILLALSYVTCYKTTFRRFIKNNPNILNSKELIKDIDQFVNFVIRTHKEVLNNG